MSKKWAIIVIAGFLSAEAYSWPWGPDVDKLEVKVSIKNTPSLPYQKNNGYDYIRGEPERYTVYLNVKNNTDFYIKEIVALCSVYDKDGNRMSKKKTYFNTRSEVAPKGNGTFEENYDPSHIGKASRAECQISSAEGSK